MPGSSFGGFTEGLASSVDRQRAEARHAEDQRSAREGNILQLLAEHGTPEIQSMALQGLIQSANPKKWKKGLGGYLGEYEPNQAVGQIHQFLSTPETATRQVAADPDAHTTPMMPQAGPPPMPGQNPEETAQPLQYHATPPPTLTETYQRPRQALMEPQEERVIGEYKGLVQAYGGGPEAEAQARTLIKDRYQKAYGHGGAGGVGVGEGNIIPDPESPTGFSQVLYDKRTGLEAQRTPAMDPTKARSVRPQYRVLAKPDGHPGLYRLNPTGDPEYVQDVPEKAFEIPVTNPDGSQSIVPVPPQWSAPGGAAGGPAATTPPPGGPAVAGPPAAPGATPPPAAPGPSGVIQKAPPPFEATGVMLPNGMKVAGKRNKVTGDLVDQHNNPLPTGSKPISVSQLTLSQNAKSSIETVNTSLQMLDRVQGLMDKAHLGTKKVDQNGQPVQAGVIDQIKGVAHGLGQKAMYSTGLEPSDPVYRELIPLTSNLTVLTQSAYLHGIRRGDLIKQIQSHMPSATDSPELIRDKMAQMRTSLNDIVNEIYAVEGQQRPHKVGDPVKGPNGERLLIQEILPDGSYKTRPR